MAGTTKTQRHEVRAARDQGLKPSYLPGANPFHPAQTLTTSAGPAVRQAAQLARPLELRVEAPRAPRLARRLRPDPEVTVLRRAHHRHRHRHRDLLPEEEESVRSRPPKQGTVFHPA